MLRISPPIRAANARASEPLPEAVVPRMTMMDGFDSLKLFLPVETCSNPIGEPGRVADL